jgi:hypothetical protein
LLIFSLFAIANSELPLLVAEVPSSGVQCLNFHSSKPLVAASQKFCKITQNRPKKESDWPRNLRLYGPFFDKSGRKPAEQNILYKAWLSACDFALNEQLL